MNRHRSCQGVSSPAASARSGRGSGRAGSPGSRAREPKRSRTASRARSRVGPLRWSKGSASCRRRSSAGSASDTPSRVSPRSVDHRPGRRQQPAGGAQDRLGVRGGLGQRVRPGGPGEVVEAQPQHHRAAHPVRRRASGGPPGRPMPASDRVELLGGVRGRRPERALRADRAAPPAARRPGAGRGCGPARAGAGRRPGRAATPAPPRRARPPARPCGCPGRAACRGHRARRPTAARPAAGAGTPARPRAATSSSPSGLATPLATLARNLVRATPTVIGSPTRSATVAAQPRRDVRRRPRDPPQPADVEERLVDGEALDQRRGVAEHLEDGLARLGVGRHPRRHDDRLRAQRAGLPPAHRRAHAAAPSPRSWPRARPRRRRSPAGRAAGGRRAARPTRRTRRGRRAGWSLRRARTYVRIAHRQSQR